MNAPSSITVGCFVDAVVVARDRAGADVDVLADGRVAQIRQVVGLRPAPERRLLQLDEVADVRLSPTSDSRPEVRERTELRAAARRASR